MKSSLSLDVLRIHVDIIFNQKLDQLRTLNRVDETCPSEMIWLLDISSSSDQTFDYFKMSSIQTMTNDVTGASDRSRS